MTFYKMKEFLNYASKITYSEFLFLAEVKLKAVVLEVSLFAHGT